MNKWPSGHVIQFGFQFFGQNEPATAVQNRLSTVKFFSTNQPYVIFSGIGQFGSTTPPPTVTSRLATLKFFDFTQPYVIFRGLGQFSGTVTPPVGGGQFIVEGSEMTETFTLNGGLTAGGVSYPLDSMSRRTV